MSTCTVKSKVNIFSSKQRPGVSYGTLFMSPLTKLIYGQIRNLWRGDKIEFSMRIVLRVPLVYLNILGMHLGNWNLYGRANFLQVNATSS